MQPLLKSIADSSLFQNFVTIVILAAGVIVGIETYPAAQAAHGEILHFLNTVVLWIFVVEIAIKMGAEGRRPWRYFNDPWNVFDFAIVAACFLPIGSQYVTVLRLLRLLRVLRLVRALPKLQMLVGALLKSIPSMAYVTILLGLLFYVYAVAAVFIFGGNDPIHFENLEIAMLSLFRVATLEDWTDVMYINMYGCENYGYDGDARCVASSGAPIVGALFFVSFVLIGTMVILNLFVGVILGGMDESQREAERMLEADRRAASGSERPTVTHELFELKNRLEQLHKEVDTIYHYAKEDAAARGT